MIHFHYLGDVDDLLVIIMFKKYYPLTYLIYFIFTLSL